MPPDRVSRDEVGPSWGKEISSKARNALIVFLIVITLYITVRFEFKMAVPTLAALVHDVLMTVGVYSLSGLEVTPATVVALLTILGYSIYDGIVVFDKVNENTRLVSATERCHVQRHGEPVAEPDADAVAQHVDHSGAPDPFAARDRLAACSARRRSRSSASRS